jgi:hypothetical protein
MGKLGTTCNYYQPCWSYGGSNRRKCRLGFRGSRASLRYESCEVERIALHVLNNQSTFSSPERYYVTKLLDDFRTRKLSQSVELKGEGIVVCIVGPILGTRVISANAAPIPVDSASVFALATRDVETCKITAKDAATLPCWTSLTKRVSSYLSPLQVLTIPQQKTAIMVLIRTVEPS